MYLSRIVLNPENLQARRALADPYAMHQLIWRGFGEEQQARDNRILFRTDIANGAAHTLVQSTLPPRWESLRQTGLLLDDQSRYLNFEPAAGQTYRFRLRANPVVRVGDKGDPMYGKRVGLVEEEAQFDWMEKKAAAGGFRVERLRRSTWGKVVSRRNNGKRPITHFAVTFDGQIRVSEPEALNEAMQTGIGPAKGFGFGLLSLAPA